MTREYQGRKNSLGLRLVAKKRSVLKGVGSWYCSLRYFPSAGAGPKDKCKMKNEKLKEYSRLVLLQRPAGRTVRHRRAPRKAAPRQFATRCSACEPTQPWAFHDSPSGISTFTLLRAARRYLIRSFDLRRPYPFTSARTVSRKSSAPHPSMAARFSP